MIFLEKRIYRAADFRTDEHSGGEKVIEGHAVVFGSLTTIGDSFYEIIDFDALTGCDMTDVALFVNHNREAVPLARTTSGTMTLTVDDIGLAIRAMLDTENSPAAKDVYSAIRRGDMSGMSFCFVVDDDLWENLDSDMPTRIIKRISKIIEVSVVSYPAYPKTDIAARGKTTLEAARQKAKADKDELTKLKKEIREKNSMASGTVNYAIFGEAFKDKNVARKIESPYDIFGEPRTETVNSPANSIVIPSYSGTTITKAFPVVSTLIDSVTNLKLHGGDSFKAPFVTGFDEAYYTDDEANDAVVDAHFDYAQLKKCRFSAFAELSEELEKLPSAQYADMVFQIVRTSIKKALSKEILFGVGNDESDSHNRITGIFSERATAIQPETDFSVSQISDILIDDILSRYGGETDIEQAAVLVISKRDLITLAKVRSSVKSRLNEVIYETGNSGRINGVPFIIDSNLPALSDPETKSGDYCMCYGNPKNYTLVEFAPLTIKKSQHYAFPQGVICFRGSSIVAGNVTRRNGFLRIKKS